MRKIALALLIVCLLAVPADAGKRQQFSFDNLVFGTGQIDSRVDQQSWWLDSGTPDPNHTVLNHVYGCSWDINDHNTQGAQSGYLNPGQSSSTSMCKVWDYNPIYQCVGLVCGDQVFHKNYVGISIEASSPGLSLEVCFQPQGGCFQPSSDVVSVLHSTTTYGWRFCGDVVYEKNDPAMQLIPDSGDGGYGIISTITMTLTNTSGAKVSNIQAGWGLSSDVFFPPGCPSDGTAPGPDTQRAYPFTWSES